MEKIIEKLKGEIENTLLAKDGADESSWADQAGVLLSRNEAQQILMWLEKVPIFDRIDFSWRILHGDNGELTPDEFNRWTADCFVQVKIKDALPEYNWAVQHYGEYLDVRIATICQKDCLPKNVPSTMHRFAAEILSFDNCGNTGISLNHYFFSNDLEELKSIVEAQFNRNQMVFANIKRKPNVQLPDSPKTESDNSAL